MKKWPKELVGEVQSWIEHIQTKPGDSSRATALSILTAIDDHYEIKIPELRELWVCHSCAKQYTKDPVISGAKHITGCPKGYFIRYQEVLDES